MILNPNQTHSIAHLKSYCNWCHTPLSHGYTMHEHTYKNTVNTLSISSGQVCSCTHTSNDHFVANVYKGIVLIPANMELGCEVKGGAHLVYVLIVVLTHAGMHSPHVAHAGTTR